MITPRLGLRVSNMCNLKDQTLNGPNRSCRKVPGKVDPNLRLFFTVFFWFSTVVLVIEARSIYRGTWFRTPCPNCRAKPFKVLAAAPRPRKKGRFRVAISDRPPSPPWDLRLRTARVRMPEIGTRARTSQYVRLQHSPNLRRACQPVWWGV